MQFRKGKFFMKRLVCIVLALVCFAAVAAADSVPSKTTGDLAQVEDVQAESMPADAGLIVAVNESGKSEEHAETCQDELGKLQETAEQTGSVGDYFGDVKDAEGNSVSLQEQLGTDNVKVNEFAPLIVDNYEESYGKVTTTFKLPTSYAQGEKVVFLVGIPNAETGEIEWIALEGVGVGEDGAIQVEFPPELLIAIQNSNALMAVASK